MTVNLSIHRQTANRLTVYGAGGHGPMKWRTLLALLQEMNQEYGPFTVAIVYGAYALCFGLLLYRKRRRKQAAVADEEP